MQNRFLFLMMIALMILSLPSLHGQEPNDGKIYYVDSVTQGVTFLASINPDGSGKTRLTPAFHNIMFPRYNKTRGWFGFTNQTPKMESEIYLMEGKRAKRILSGATLEDFSPDGKFMLYITSNYKAELYVYNIQRKRAVKVSQDLKVEAARWSPDGEWIIASVMTDDGTTDIYLISTMAQGIVRLTATEGANESFPYFCNDSITVLYMTDRYGDFEMEYMETKRPEIYRPGVLGMYPTMSPDNEWIVYESQNRIMTAGKTGFNPTFVTAGKTPIWLEK